MATRSASASQSTITVPGSAVLHAHSDNSARAGPTARGRLLLGAGLIVAAAAVLPFDGAVSQFFTRFRPGGDLRREIELIQQFGGPVSIALATLLIWRLDAPRLKRIVEWILAAGIAWLTVFVMKISLGRPRPKFLGEHLHFLGPWNTHIVKEGDPPRHAWEINAPDVAEIWSMPSSHTALAVVAAAWLSRQYPRLTPIVVPLACVVGACRVLLKAHYASDVFVGAAIGLLATEVCVTLSRRRDRSAPPA